MRRPIRLMCAAMALGAGLAGVGGITVAGATLKSNAKAPTCLTVSSSELKSVLGGTPQSTPSTGSSSNSFYGYKQTTLTCTYSTTANISYSTPATVADYKTALKTLTVAAGAKTVSGIGDGAFYGTGSNTSSSCPASTNGKPVTCKNVTVTTDNLWVLVTGTTFFEISASKVTFSEEETLAKKIVSLV